MRLSDIFSIGSAIVFFAYAPSAMAQRVQPSTSQSSTSTELSQQDQFLRVVDRTDDASLVLVYRRDLGFRNLLRISQAPISRNSIRLCDGVTQHVEARFFGDSGITRDQWDASLRSSLSSYFRVTAQFLDIQSCQLFWNHTADAAVITGLDLKAVIRKLVTQGALIDPRTQLPIADFSMLGQTLNEFSAAMANQQRLGGPEQQRRAADASSRKDGIQQEFARWEKLAKAGDAEAALHGIQLAEAAHDHGKLIFFKTLQAEVGPPALKLEVAKNLLGGLNGFPKDIVGGRQLLEQAVALGHVPSMVALADQLSRPTGFTEENTRALQLLEQAKASGDPTAAVMLRDLQTHVSQNDWRRLRQRLTSYAPWLAAGLALVLLVIAGFVQRHSILQLFAAMTAASAAAPRRGIEQSTLPYRASLFQQLSAIGALSSVWSREGVEKIIVSDPWMVANPKIIRASQVLLALGGATMVLGFGHPFLFGVASLFVTAAMLVRLMAPRFCGLPLWNNFVVLGSPQELHAAVLPDGAATFGSPSIQKPLNNLHDEELPTETKEAIAGVFAFRAAAHSIMSNPADAILLGGRHYARAQMALTAGEALWNMRKTVKGFFAACIALGTSCVLIMASYDGSDVAKSMPLLAPFAFSGTLLYCLLAPKWFRGRILPYRGKLLMHESSTLNAVMTKKVVLNHIAFALTAVPLCVLGLFARYFFSTLNPDRDPEIDRVYPTSVPTTGYIYSMVPISVTSALVVASDSPWMMIPIYVLPGLMAVATQFMGAATDVVRYLSEDDNRYALQGARIAAQQSGNLSTTDELRACYERAARAGVELDATLDNLFAKEAAEASATTNNDTAVASNTDDTHRDRKAS